MSGDCQSAVSSGLLGRAAALDPDASSNVHATGFPQDLELAVQVGRLGKHLYFDRMRWTLVL